MKKFNFKTLLILAIVIILALSIVLVSCGKKADPTPEPEPVLQTVPVPEAPGTAGDLKLYDTDPKDAAMVMAIVADSLGKPLNELRFISIREVKEDEV